MCLVAELADICSDRRRVRFRTAHFHVALHHWVTVGWCR